MKGKECCKILKEIRKRIADENDIAYVTSECKHQGDCLGTCPKCESEVAYLERELNRRRAVGKAVTVAGLAVVTAVSGGCLNPGGTKGTQLQGDLQVGTEQTQTTDILMGGMEKDPDETTDEVVDIPGEIVETATAGSPPYVSTDMSEDTVEELMGDIAYLPPPELSFLTDVCGTADDFVRELNLCRRDDIVSHWAEFLKEASDQYDTFLQPSEDRLLVLSYDESGYVVAAELQDR